MQDGGAAKILAIVNNQYVNEFIAMSISLHYLQVPDGSWWR